MGLRAINYYMRGYDKTEAMRMAGYAPASIAGNMKHFWHSKAVKAEIRERMRKLAAKNEMTIKRALDYLSSLLELTPGDVLGEDGKVKDWKDIPPEVARLMNFRATPRGIVVESIDKLRVLELMGKFSGWVQDTINVKLDGDLHTKIALARQQLAVSGDLPRLEGRVASPATHLEVIDVCADLAGEGPDGEAGAEGPEETGERPGAVEPGDEGALGEVADDQGVRAFPH